MHAHRTLSIDGLAPLMSTVRPRARTLLHTCAWMLALMLPTSCGEQPVAPVVAETRAFDWMNNPDNGNIRIIRFEDVFAASWTDASNGLRATHSTFPLGPNCGPQEELDPISNQLTGVIDPEDFFASWFRLNSAGTVWITIRDLNQAGNCFGALLGAEGWGQINNTDNDVFGLTEGDHHANAWGVMARGSLTTPAGTQLNYAGHFRARSSFAGGGKLLSAVVNVH